MSELPKGWVEASFLEIVDLHDAVRVPLNKSERSAKSGKYPYYGANGLVDYIDDYLFDGEYVLLAEDGGNFDVSGKAVAYKVNGKFWVNNHAHIMSPRASISAAFILHWCNSWNWMPFVGGTTRLKLTQDGMRKVRLALPPLAEQKRIVAKLDVLNAKSAGARTELARIETLVSRYKQAVLGKAFSGELYSQQAARSVAPVPQETAGQIDGRTPDLPALPETWRWVALSTCAEVSGGLTKNAKRDSLPLQVPYLRVANVYANELRLDDVSFIGCTENEVARTKLVADDLLVVEGNGSLDQIGRVALWAGELEHCVHQNHLIKVRPSSNLVSKFALYWLLSPLGRRAIEAVAASSSGLHTLSLSKVGGLPLPHAPLAEQHEIIRRIEAAFVKIDRLATEAKRALELVGKLDEAILAKAFRGELVPQDENDEPAEHLLARIRTAREAAPKGRRGRNSSV